MEKATKTISSRISMLYGDCDRQRYIGVHARNATNFRLPTSNQLAQNIAERAEEGGLDRGFDNRRIHRDKDAWCIGNLDTVSNPSKIRRRNVSVTALPSQTPLVKH